jgi:murein DD-endopeptidase MepM/ murein hydrolase activator NlpD
MAAALVALAILVSHISFDSAPTPVPILRDARFWDPMPGGTLGGYAGDTGLDIGGKQLPVYALAAGTIDYAEYGHTRWVGPRDTAYCVRIALDVPIAYRGHAITHVYYAHLSALEFTQVETTSLAARRHVAAGERLGTSGIANGAWHLHLGLLLDGRVEQDDWAFILREDEIREVLGGYRNGQRW